MINTPEFQPLKPAGKETSATLARICVVLRYLLVTTLILLVACSQTRKANSAGTERPNSSNSVSTITSTLSQRAITDALEMRVDQALAYLTRELNRWTQGTVVYDGHDSGGASFFPSGWMGDVHDLKIDPGHIEDQTTGTTSLRITYHPRGDCGFAGIAWSYPDRPDGNWGHAPGRSLVDAKRLRGWIRGDAGGERVGIKIGGINRPPFAPPCPKPQNKQSLPYYDSFVSLEPELEILTTSWKQFERTIPDGADVSSVIGGLTVVLSRTLNGTGATIYLKDVTYDDAGKDFPRFVRSYVPQPGDDDKAIRNAAFVYDNALVLLTFLARGDTESLSKAKLLADTFVAAQDHDRLHQDGRWRNAYSSGPLLDPATEKARLPGWYDPHVKKWREDRYAVSSDTGNAAWAMIALLSAHSRLTPGQQSPYLTAALKAGEWIEQTFRVNNKLAGYKGGFEGWDLTAESSDPLKWQSTEHNIDLFVAFSKLAVITGDTVWQERADHARKFVLAMWNRQGKYFWTGTEDLNGKVNEKVVPADAQTWAILAMGHDPVFRCTIEWNGPPTIPTCLEWVESYCRLSSVPDCPGVAGYRFSDIGKGAWFEGAAHTAAAYWYLGDKGKDRAESILTEIVMANTGSSGFTGGIYAACPERAFTGFKKEFAPGEVDDWTYPRRLHIGATAWFVLASLGVNPYWMDGLP